MDLNWDHEQMTMEEAIRRAIARRMGARGKSKAAGTLPRLVIRRRQVTDAEARAS